MQPDTSSYVVVSKKDAPSFQAGTPSFAAVSKEDAGREQPSSQAKGVWDSVVSWMKMAVDFIALDSTADSLPSAAPHGKVIQDHP